MKKINKKGFTLIELLAVIIILGVLLLIAVPSVSKYIQQSREKTYANNLSKFVDAVSTEVNSYTSDYSFKTDEYLVVPIVCIELERGDNSKSPFSNYNALQSYVVVTRGEGNIFEYKVAALDQAGFGSNLSAPTEVKIIRDANPTKIAVEKDGEGNPTAATIDLDIVASDGETELKGKVGLPGSSCLSKLK